MSYLDPLFKTLGILAKNKEVYEVALTHSSVNAVSNKKHQDYERLEFLGDSMVGEVAGELCYRYHPEMQQGDLSILKSQFIRTESEADLAKAMGLVPYIKVGPSFTGKVEDNLSVLEDCFESFIGAMLLDQGLEFTHKFVWKLFEEPIKFGTILYEENPKSELQEAIQADTKETVVYKLLKEEGPDHDKIFTLGVFIDNKLIASGMGYSKQQAQTKAAAAAIRRYKTDAKKAKK